MTLKKNQVVNYIFVIALIAFVPNNVVMTKNNVDPFSKINIKSQSAICQKDNIKPQTYFFTYQENVLVTLADGSAINSEILQIELNAGNFSKTTKNTSENPSGKNSKQNKDFSSAVKKIKFKNNVKLHSTNKTIEANVALIDLEKKVCYLSGEVKIEQKTNQSSDSIEQKSNNKNPKKSKDLPLITFCDKACLNFETEKITLLGNKDKPVNTTIEIEKKSMRLKKKKKRLI